MPGRQSYGQSLSSRVLFDAICEGDLKSVKFCLENGAKINEKDKTGQSYGRSPLYIAAKHGQFEIVKFLIQNGADINAKTNNGRSVLYIAAYSGNVEIVKFLHQNGADINAKHNHRDGWSPLHCAAYQGHLEVVKYLVQNGALLNSKDKKNKTPLDYAISNCKDDIVKYLKNAGAEEKVEKEANISSSNDFMAADYYSILGVQKGTWLITENLKREMKRTYNKLALKYHPDKNKSEDATEKFKRIKNAFEVLSDPRKKRVYDHFGEEGLKKMKN